MHQSSQSLKKTGITSHIQQIRDDDYLSFPALHANKLQATSNKPKKPYNKKQARAGESPLIYGIDSGEVVNNINMSMPEILEYLKKKEDKEKDEKENAVWKF